MSLMSLEILNLVVSSQTSYELWKSLERQFRYEFIAKKVHLKMLLSNLKKRSLSIIEYFTKLITFTDNLALARNPLSNIDLITHLITGLDYSYYPVVVYFESNMLTMDLGEAYAILLTHKARLENSKLNDNKEATNNYVANVAQAGNGKFQKKGIEMLRVTGTEMEVVIGMDIVVGTLTLMVKVVLVVMAKKVFKDKTEDEVTGMKIIEELLVVLKIEVALEAVEITSLKDELPVKSALGSFILLLSIKTCLIGMSLQNFLLKATFSINIWN